MQFRLPKAFVEFQQEIRFIFFIFCPFFLVLAGGRGATAQAALTINSVTPYRKDSGNTVYHVKAGVEVDAAAGFLAFDLTDQSDPADLILLDVSTDKNFGGLGVGQDVVITVTVGGQSVPISRVAPSGQSLVACDSLNCQDSDGSSFYAARYSTSTIGQLYRVGFFPKEICQTIGNLAGVCSGGSVIEPTTGVPTVFDVKVYIGLEEGDGTIGKISDSEENASVKISFSTDAPNKLGCLGSLATSYTPGDGEVSFNPTSSALLFTVTSGAAPIDTLLFLAKDGARPSNFGSEGQINARVSSSQPSVISGFTNTTNGSDHFYYVSIGARDLAGAISKGGVGEVPGFCPNTLPDDNFRIQTASVQGLLKKSQCFIATATFRSADDPIVLMLRGFRDEVLNSFGLGRFFVSLYQRFSPALAEAILKNPALRVSFYILLMPLEWIAWGILNPFFSLLICLGSLGVVFVRKRSLLFLGIVIMYASSLVVTSQVLADEEEVEEGSYIESIQSTLKRDSSESEEGSFIEQNKAALLPEDDQSLIESVQSKGKVGPDVEGESFIQEQRAKITDSSTRYDGAIEDFKLGKKKLGAQKGKRKGEAFGLTVSVRRDQKIVGQPTAVFQSYDSIYGANQSPDLQIFYEIQPFHGEWLGSLGLFGQMGFSWSRGAGSFSVPPSLAGGGASPQTSIEFTFLSVPATVGASYRLNLLRVIRPYLKAGGSLIGYVEDRSDNKKTLWGNSRGYFVGAGVAIPLNFLDSVASWSLFEAHGIHRMALSLDYYRLQTVSGALDFNSNNVSLGLLFEL